MSSCPVGLSGGFGMPMPLANALCVSRSYFGHDSTGLGIYVSGTGWLFHTEGNVSMVMTAAHNLYHHGVGRRAQWIAFYFGRRGQSAAASREANRAVFPEEFLGSYAPVQWDFGVAFVKALGTDRFQPIPFAQSTGIADTEKLIVGYPDEGVCKGKFLPYHARFSVFPSGPTNYGYRDQQTYVGMSGAPLLARTEGALLSYGIHIRGDPGPSAAPRAVRFSPPVLQRVRNWV